MIEEKQLEALHEEKDKRKIIEGFESFANARGNIVTLYEKEKWQNLYVLLAINKLKSKLKEK